MSFNINGFQYGRGVTSTYTQGGGITTVIHSYKSTDSLATITTPGYFPPNIDGTSPPDKVFIGDLLAIISGTNYDEASIVIITGLNPLTLSPSPFAGGGFSVGAPINATDNFGLQIAAGTPNVFTLEYATIARPGIVNAFTQSFGGNKIFTSLQITTDPFAFPLEKYAETSILTTFADGANLTGSFTILLNRLNKTTTLHMTGGLSFVTGAAPGVVYTSVTLLPEPFRPAFPSYGYFQAKNETTGAGQACTMVIGTGGDIKIFWDESFTTTFPVVSTVTFFNNSIVYNTPV